MCKRRHEYDSVFIFYSYFSTALPLILLARLMGKTVHVDFRTVPIKRFFWGRLLRYLCAVAANNYSLINNHVLAEMFIKAVSRDHKVLPIRLDLRKFGLGPGQEEYDGGASLITKYRIEQVFTFIYVGTIHKTRQIEDMVLAFDKVTKSHSQVHY